MVSSSDLKYKLIRHVTFNHYFSGLLQDLFNVFLYEIQLFYSFNVVHFFQGTSVSIIFYLFEHYELWMMDSKAQRVFFAKTSKSQHLL